MRRTAKLGMLVWAIACGCGVPQMFWGDSVPDPPPILFSPGPAPVVAKTPALPQCASSQAPLEQRGDARSRAAAQRGLDFLARDTVEWQREHQCYGCHVQAVTLEAMVVGRRHHYRVQPTDLAEVLRGMTELPGGAHGPVGFSVGDSPSHLYDSSQNFGGAALASYDELDGSNLSDALVATAERLLPFQEEHGGQKASESRLPIGAGALQATMQAAQTWRQAYARTADERWLVPIAKAEAYLRGEAKRLQAEPTANLQHVNYALLGLHAAGAHANDGAVAGLRRSLLARQNQDGGWGFAPGEASDAFATGQTLYVIKRLGADDREPAVARGMAWLVERQGEDGSWSADGSRRGEAMWGVLGLVSVDVASLSIAGLEDGQHLAQAPTLQGNAVANGDRPVESLEFRIDDVPVARVCGGATLTHRLDPSALPPGRHHVDLVAINAARQQSRARIEFFTGDHFLTQEASHFEGGTTHLTWRNVAPADLRGTVKVEIREQVEQEGQWTSGLVVHTAVLPATPGPMRHAWSGAPGHRYAAHLEFVDDRGQKRHQVMLPFVHDTAEAQRRNFAAVEGELQLMDGESAANAEVELVDDQGRVVQKVKTTRSGRYRFKNIDAGQYEVRVKRQGFKEEKAKIEAAPASSSKADLKLELH